MAKVVEFGVLDMYIMLHMIYEFSDNWLYDVNEMLIIIVLKLNITNNVYKFHSWVIIFCQSLI